MVSLKEIETMDLGLKEGEKYIIYGKNKRKKGEAIIEGIYIGQSGVRNDYLIFMSTKSKIKECFLKIDIIIGEYRIVRIKGVDKKMGFVKHG